MCKINWFYNIGQEIKDFDEIMEGVEKICKENNNIN